MLLADGDAGLLRPGILAAGLGVAAIAMGCSLGATCANDEITPEGKIRANSTDGPAGEEDD